MPASAPYIKTVLRTVPRRDLDEMAKKHLAVKRPFDMSRDTIMDNLVSAASGSLGPEIRADIVDLVTTMLEERT